MERVNLLGLGIFKWHYWLIFESISMLEAWGVCSGIAFRWISLGLSLPTLIQVISLCRQLTIHCLSRCYSSFMSIYGVTRPQGVNVCGLIISITFPRNSVCSSSPWTCHSSFSCDSWRAGAMPIIPFKPGMNLPLTMSWQHLFELRFCPYIHPERMDLQKWNCTLEVVSQF